MKQRYVYAIVAGREYVKFGVATSPLNRFAYVQTFCPLPLSLLATIGPVPNDQCFELERLIHRALVPIHVRGEWFLVRPKSIAVMKLMRDGELDKLMKVLPGWAEDEDKTAKKLAGSGYRNMGDVLENTSKFLLDA